MRALSIVIVACLIMPQSLLVQAGDPITGKVTAGVNDTHRTMELQSLPGMKYTAEEIGQKHTSKEEKQLRFIEVLLGIAAVIGVVWYDRSGR